MVAERPAIKGMAKVEARMVVVARMVVEVRMVAEEEAMLAGALEVVVRRVERGAATVVMAGTAMGAAATVVSKPDMCRDN